MLGDGLEDDVASRQRVVGRGGADALEHLGSVLARHLAALDRAVDAARDALEALSDGVVTGLAEDDLETRPRRDLADPGAHRAAPDDTDSSNL